MFWIKTFADLFIVGTVLVTLIALVGHAFGVWSNMIDELIVVATLISILFFVWRMIDSSEE